MRKPIIAGNWKMNKTLSEAKSFVEELKIPFHLRKIDSVVCAPALFLQSLVELTKETDVEIGAQNDAL